MKKAAARLFLIATIALSGAAFADDKASAQASFDLGRQLMVEGRFGEACPKLEESLRLQSGVGTMLFLAACYEKTGRTASAWAQFREAESLATRVNDGRAQVAREKANALEPKLAKLAIVVPVSLRSISGLEVKRDNVTVGPAVYDAPIPVDPGVRRVVVSAPGKKAWASEVTVATEDARATLRLPEGLEDGPEEARGAGTGTGTSTSGTDGDEGKTQRVIGLVVGGVGLVSLAVSAGFGLSAKSKLDESNAPGHCVGNKCDDAGTNARNDARDLATVSTVTFFVGLAAVGGGAALFFTAPKSKRSVVAIAPTLRGVSVSGSF